MKPLAILALVAALVLLWHDYEILGLGLLVGAWLAGAAYDDAGFHE